jgi:hypothetical protein
VEFSVVLAEAEAPDAAETVPVTAQLTGGLLANVALAT